MTKSKQNQAGTMVGETPTRPSPGTRGAERQPTEHYGRRATDASILPIAEDIPNRTAGGIIAVIPAYNEERFIGSVVLKTCQVATTVIVVDDGSTDATAQIAAAAGAVVVVHEENQGKGTALNTGFQVARDYHPEAVVMLDADGQHRPEDLAAVVAPILLGEADFVIGSRYMEDTSQVPRLRIWGHWWFNLLTRLTSGTAASDSQSGYRAFSPRALSAASFSSEGFSVESEMQFIAHEQGLRLVEVPITICYSDKPKRNVMGHGASVLNGLLHLAGQYRPLLVFGLVGFLQIFTGLILGYRVVYLFSKNSELAVGTAMLSILFVITGTLSLSTGFILHSMRALLLDLIGKNGSR